MEVGLLALFTYTGEDEMLEDAPFSIEQFYKFIGEKKLMAAKCNKCDTLLVPPRPLCMRCFSTDFSWVELKNRGKLLTYTVIYIAPPQFQSDTPYAYGIIELEDGPRLPGMIRNMKPEEIRVGMELVVDFDVATPQNWPQWPRYFFRPS